MEEKKLWELIGKKVTGEADAGELAELNRLLEKFPEALYALETMENYWKASPERAERDLREASLDRHLQRLQHENTLKAGKRPRAIVKYLLLGASAAAACILLYYFLPAMKQGRNPPSVPGTSTVTVTTGTERRRLTLPDGSVVWLNAATTVSYSTTYTKDSLRKLVLTGEAFFQVKHDPQHPFTVQTRNLDIVDIGTAFNVNAYAADSDVEATLMEGAIEVKWNKGAKHVLMTKPNQKCTVFTGAGTDRISDVKPSAGDRPSAEAVWLQDSLAFHNETFRNIAVKMERKYGISIQFDKPEQANYRFTGVFTHETPEQALQELQLIGTRTRTFHFTRKNNTIIIKE
jgi:ferric-dicitrate binding protein FerR (iron transport regulator)